MSHVPSDNLKICIVALFNVLNTIFIVRKMKTMFQYVFSGVNPFGISLSGLA